MAEGFSPGDHGVCKELQRNTGKDPQQETGGRGGGVA